MPMPVSATWKIVSSACSSQEMAISRAPSFFMYLMALSIRFWNTWRSRAFSPCITGKWSAMRKWMCRVSKSLANPSATAVHQLVQVHRLDLLAPRG